MPDTNDANAEVNRVAIKIPPFWQKNPARWFSQTESQFAIANITQDDTKFHHIVANLDASIAEEVGDIIDSPPQEGKYDALKKEVIARLSTSTEQRIRRLLEGEEMGDRRPSQFLRHLRGLAGAAASDAILRSLWISRLPNHAQAILVMDDDVALDKVAQKADKIVETLRPPQPQLAEASGQRDDSLSLVSLYKAVEALEEKISRLLPARENPGRSRSRPRSRSRSRSRTQDPQVCWYHNRFADRATKCTAPCNFNAGNANVSR